MTTHRGRVILVSTTFITALASTPLWAAGHLNPAFGTDGVVVTPTGGENAETGSRAVAVDANGKVVALASRDAGETVVARYGHTGALDPTFGVGGMVTLPLARPFWGLDVAIADGKIVVAGSSLPSVGQAEVAVVRLDGTGALDATFGAGGLATTQVPGAGAGSGAWRVAIAGDGSVLVAGNHHNGVVPPVTGSFVARFDSGGVLDPGYGTAGIAILSIDDTQTLRGFGLMDDGRAVVAGGFGPQAVNLPYSSFFVARLDASGAPDSTFGSGGIVTGTINGYFESIALGPDGTVTAAGPGGGGTLFSKLVIQRFLPDGSLDPTFGTAGVSTTILPNNDFAGLQAVLIQPDGRIVGVGSHLAARWKPALIRLHGNGQLDQSFGYGGMSFFPLWGPDDTPPFGEHLFVHDAALAPNGDIVTADGMYSTPDAPPPAVRLSRFLGRGLPCSTTGTIVGARLAMTGFNSPTAKRSVVFKGVAELPVTVPALANDLDWTSLGLVVRDAAGRTLFEELVPPANSSVANRWYLGGEGTKAAYTSVDPRPTIRRARLKTGGRLTPFQVAVQVKAKATPYGVSNPDPPFTVSLLLNHEDGVCAATTFAVLSCRTTATAAKCR